MPSQLIAFAPVRAVVVTALVGAASLGGGDVTFAQTPVISEAECQSLRQRLADHTRLSDGVRRSVAALAATSPAPPAAAPAPAPPASRADAVRSRLDQIAKERQTLEDQRLAAMVRLDLSRAAQIQGQMQLLDTEKANLERELAALPAGPAAPAPAAPVPTPPAPTAARSADTDRIRCQDLPAALDTAVKIRQRELGAREGQSGVVPLVALKGQTAEQIAQELAGQFPPWPAAMTQVGLLDNDGDGRLDGFADVPAPDVFRLYRQRADGSVSVETFTLPGRGGAGYGEIVRRIDEATARQTGKTLTDLLTIRPAGSGRVLAESAQFGETQAHFMAGNFAEAAKVEGGVARTVEFQNFRGENVRALEIIGPASGGVIRRQVVVTPRPNNQEQWEEIVTQIRPVSYWRTDVEVSAGRETRTTTGTLVGTRSTSAPARFSLER